MITVTFHLKRIAEMLNTLAFRIAKLADTINAKSDST